MSTKKTKLSGALALVLIIGALYAGGGLFAGNNTKLEDGQLGHKTGTHMNADNKSGDHKGKQHGKDHKARNNKDKQHKKANCKDSHNEKKDCSQEQCN